jgi:molybdopterin biosynthesis enzyme
MVAGPHVAQRIARLTPLKDALDLVDRSVCAVGPREVETSAAVGRILASAGIAVSDPRPTTALALRDGWAVQSYETLDAGSYAPAVLTQVPQAVEVGDPLPENADAVAPFDAVEFRGAIVNALLPLAPGEGVLERAADAGAGEALFRAGRPISLTEIALLSAIGHARISVREPRVRVVSARPSGDTLVDAIVALLGAAVDREGGVASKGASTDASGAAAFSDEDDALIVVGGTGTGDRDHSISALAHCGKLAFHGVGLSPGETSAFGMVGPRPVLVVPGRLDAALAAWLVLGRRMLARLTARDDCESDAASPVTLARKITSTIGLAEVIVARRDGGSAVPLASGYLSLQALAQADGWIFVPADLEGIPADAIVSMMPLP